MPWRLTERLQRLAGHFCALAGNRLSIFGLEWQAETARLLGYLALLLAVVALAGLAILFATGAVLVLAWQRGELLLATCLVAIFYGVLAVAGGWLLWWRLHTADAPFAVTRAEFERDREALRGVAGNES